MDDLIIESIRIRPDLVGDYTPTDKMKGYKAEAFLKRILRYNDNFVTKHLQNFWGFLPYIQWLPHVYTQKYKNYLRDKEARKYIYEKYAERQSIVDIICDKITDLDSKECIRLKEFYEEKLLEISNPILELVDEIVKDYKSELKLLIADDTDKT